MYKGARRRTQIQRPVYSFLHDFVPYSLLLLVGKLGAASLGVEVLVAIVPVSVVAIGRDMSLPVDAQAYRSVAQCIR